MSRASLALLTAALLSVICASHTYALEGTVYVTDELRLGLYADEQTTGRPFRTLQSGEKLQILERALMSVLVRSESGAEGWVKSAFLVTEPTARLKLTALQETNTALTAEIDSLKAARESLDEQIASLQTDLAAVRQGVERLPEVERENQRLQSQIAAISDTVPSYWLAIAALAALIAGALGGYFWLDRRVRKQFGGVKVY